MTDTDGYNGWTNRETWAVALHINNDQGWQDGLFEALKGAKQAWLDTPGSGESPFTHSMAGEIIKDNVEEILSPEDTGDGMELNQAQWLAIQDIGSLWRVDWTELGASFLSDLAEQEEYSNR